MAYETPAFMHLPNPALRLVDLGSVPGPRLEDPSDAVDLKVCMSLPSRSA